MITGCNTNIRHLGKPFHVQTEDSGRDNPHIISHVYHGGTIIASEKREYRDRIDSADLDSVVRRLIEEQHKTMLKKLRRGVFDAAIGERLGIAVGEAPPARVRAKAAAEPQRVELASADPGSGSTAGATGPAGGDTAPSFEDELSSPERAPADRAAAPAFGGGSDSEKPLDEVILEYLVEKARGRSKGNENRPARSSRSKE